jgi:SAM-dependent methyltransferase
MNLDGWQKNYERGRANRYPYDTIVSAVMREYGQRDRANVAIMDLGCGGGNHVAFLRNEGFSYYGCDGAPAAIELTRKYLGEDAGDRLKVASFSSLPWSSGTFDAVIDRQSMGHNELQDIRPILAEIYRVLKPGGMYIGHLFSRATDALRFGQEGKPGDFSAFTGGMFGQSHLVHAFTEDEVTELFSAFVIVSLYRQTRHELLSGDVVETFEVCAKKIAVSDL